MPEAEWNDEHTRIICELFAEQVQAGNRPKTHLNNFGYREVASKFQQRTELLYTKLQLKNKWEKLKADYIIWKKLLIAGADLSWDTARRTFAASDDWWKKTNKELPGARKFRNAGLRNEDQLSVMFDYIASNGVEYSPQEPSAPDSPNGVDHLPLATDALPFATDRPMNGTDHVLVSDGLQHTPDSPTNGINLDTSDNNTERNGGTHPGHESEFPSNSNRNKKRPFHVHASKKNKKSKIETALLMQAQLNRIAELAKKAQTSFEKFTSQADASRPSIQDVMTLVRECGARYGSNEHFIATELFVNGAQREMFLTMETAGERLHWLRRKYIAKYES